MERFAGIAGLEFRQRPAQGLQLGAALVDGLLVLVQFPLPAFGLQLLLQAGAVNCVSVALGAAHVRANSTW